MRILIVEDELLQARRLSKILIQIEPTCEILGIAKSIEETINFLDNDNSIQLIMMDIELADGQSFDIFKIRPINIPVIFTTAYNDFAIKAFKVNAIDYLLKPINEEELVIAINKVKNSNRPVGKENIVSLLAEIQKYQHPAKYKKRFLVKQAQKMISIGTTEIAYFFSDGGFSFIRTVTNQKYLIEYTLDEIESSISPENFFRANRQYILSNKCILSIHKWFNQKLKVEVKPSCEEHIVISRDKANAFKSWMGE